jgi:hypothetical protein
MLIFIILAYLNYYNNLFIIYLFILLQRLIVMLNFCVYY